MMFIIFKIDIIIEYLEYIEMIGRDKIALQNLINYLISIYIELCVQRED